MIDLYEYFGLDKTATLTQIKKAYRKKSKEVHPDMKNGGQKLFEQCKFYYDILSNPEKREIYNETGKLPDSKPDNEESKILGLLYSYIQRVLQSPIDITNTDLIKEIEKTVKKDIKEKEKYIESLPEQQNILKKVQRKIKKVKGDLKSDIIYNFLEQQIVSMDLVAKQEEIGIDYLDKVLDILDDYEYRFEDLLNNKRIVFSMLGAEKSFQNQEKDFWF